MNETPLIYHVSSVLEYFRDVFRAIAAKQQLKVQESTEHYIVTLLTGFSRSEKLYTVTPTGAYRVPLMTELLSEACEAGSDVPPIFSATGRLVKSVFQRGNGHERAIYRRADCWIFEASRERRGGEGFVPQARF